jgi:hypothetical protein
VCVALSSFSNTTEACIYVQNNDAARSQEAHIVLPIPIVAAKPATLCMFRKYIVSEVYSISASDDNMCLVLRIRERR